MTASNAPDNVIPYSTVTELCRRWRERLGLRSYTIEIIYQDSINPAVATTGEFQEIHATHQHIEGNQHNVTFAGTNNFDLLRECVIHELLHCRIYPMFNIFHLLNDIEALTFPIFNVLKADYNLNMEFVVSGLTDQFRKIKEFDDEDLRPKKDK